MKGESGVACDDSPSDWLEEQLKEDEEYQNLLSMDLGVRKREYESTKGCEMRRSVGAVSCTEAARYGGVFAVKNLVPQNVSGQFSALCDPNTFMCLSLGGTEESCRLGTDFCKGTCQQTSGMDCNRAEGQLVVATAFNNRLSCDLESSFGSLLEPDKSNLIIPGNEFSDPPDW